MGYLPAVAQAGTYQVVATVRDQTEAGIGTYKFIVVSDLMVEATVDATKSLKSGYGITATVKTTTTMMITL